MNTATTQARFWFSPSRNHLTWREPSEAIYPLTAPCDWRPLVVIDPEDREQVALILSRYHEWKWTPDIAEASIDDMQAALREFADPKPPRPEEPTGLGAVVEDRWGHVFVRVGGRAWRNVNEETFCMWIHIDAVRVLSEGVRDA